MDIANLARLLATITVGLTFSGPSNADDAMEAGDEG